MPGPALEPRHSTRKHLEREGDVEWADYDPSVQTEPYTINTRFTLGGGPDMIVTGIDRERPVHPNRASTNSTGASTDGEPEMEKIGLVTYESDTDPIDPHNWSFACRVSCTTLLAFLGSLVLMSSIIDASALKSMRKLFDTSFELETVPTGE